MAKLATKISYNYCSSSIRWSTSRTLRRCSCCSIQKMQNKLMDRTLPQCRWYPHFPQRSYCGWCESMVLKRSKPLPRRHQWWCRSIFWLHLQKELNEALTPRETLKRGGWGRRTSRQIFRLEWWAPRRCRQILQRGFLDRRYARISVRNRRIPITRCSQVGQLNHIIFKNLKL